MPDSRPVIALSCGDPSGVGPEIVVKALAGEEIHELARVVVLGDRTALVKAILVLGLDIVLHEVAAPAEGLFLPGKIDLILSSSLSPSEHAFGRTTPACGQAAYEAVAKAVDLILSGQAEAMTTAPLAKSSLQAAGHDFPGHTELLAELGGGGPPVMLLAGSRLKVALVTTHLALGDVPGRIEAAKIGRVIRLGQDFMRRLGVENPRIGVCGLNPHAGEGGLFGEEDQKIIRPAVEAACGQGLAAVGPEPPDTIFVRAAQGEFDLIVAMYHDQGLIPLKLLHFKEAVNVTLGLPIIRTSVGHGTAFDLAGTGRADPTSLVTALRLAVKLARPEAVIQVWD